MIFDAIRYYFENGKLVKISAGQYFGSGADLDGIRTIIKVTDFQDSADRKLFQLPKELKDIYEYKLAQIIKSNQIKKINQKKDYF